ncbi:complement decay-accelerating factor isoform X2 [Parambassis ranga]|uniref:Complement decay-accelerating factor isoform X2 n=1 Tax=Parambassis ranga TaxID=210632 RepID=A0A6P7IB04_9TELE|nr:complement decay-accelerating factor-like isoform X2 [Parambassis ranga]
MEFLLDTCGQLRLKSLLLMYLFVWKAAAADCPKPEGGKNTVLTNESLLMNDFPDGVSASLQCSNGYEKESGSGIITCAGGTWTDSDLICRRKDCGQPRPQPHMRFNTTMGTLFGDIAEVICDKGYTISGTSYKQCFAGGWFGRSTCEIVTCDLPPELDNGQSLRDAKDEPKYGEMILYSCDEGYTLVGSDSIVCTETGEYDSQPPHCKGATTEVVISTKNVPASTSPSQETPTSADSSATSTAYTDKTLTTSAAPTASPTVQGARDIGTAEEKATPKTLTTQTSSQGMHDGDVDTNTDNGYVPVIISVICVTIVALLVVLLLHRYLLKRKGSYDTREDLKPELLQFQNL